MHDRFRGPEYGLYGQAAVYLFGLVEFLIAPAELDIGDVAKSFLQLRQSGLYAVGGYHNTRVPAVTHDVDRFRGGNRDIGPFDNVWF